MTLPSPHDAMVIAVIAAVVYVTLVAVAQFLRRRAGMTFGVTFHLFALVVGLLAGVDGSAWRTATSAVVMRHLAALAVLLAALPVASVLNRLLWRKSRADREAQGAPPRVLADTTAILVALVALLVVLEEIYDVRVPGLLAGSGVVAIILGLALQDLLGNLFAGIALYLQKSFTTGDWLLVDGIHARVIEVSWRSTRLVTTDDVLIDVPNRDIVTRTITNFEQPTPRHAVRVTIGLHYDAPPARAQEVLAAAAASVRGVADQPPPVVRVKEFADSSIVYEIKAWIDHHGEADRVASDVRSHCWYAVRRAGIEIPYPILTLRRAAPDRSADRARSAAARALVSHPIFGALTSAQIADLVGESPVLLFSPSEHVVEQGAPGESMFLLVRGRVQVLRGAPGRMSAVAELGPGDCFGEMSVLTGEPRSATVVALEEIEAVEITKAAAARLVTGSPDVIGRLSELLAVRQAANEQARAGGAEVDAAAASRAGMLRRLRGFFQLD